MRPDALQPAVREFIAKRFSVQSREQKVDDMRDLEQDVMLSLVEAERRGLTLSFELAKTIVNRKIATYFHNQTQIRKHIVPDMVNSRKGDGKEREPADPKPGPERVTEGRSNLSRVITAMTACLTSEEISMLTQVVQLEMSYEKVSELWGISTDKVRSRIFSARRKLANYLRTQSEPLDA
jgi:RNA polymerase sigma factor (sigma-70 family)